MYPLDTIYGSQDKKDDIRIGIGSTAQLFTSTTTSKLFLALLGMMFLFCLTMSGILNGIDTPYSPYYLISVFATGMFLARQLWHLDLESPESCSTAFGANAFVVGPIVALGMLLEYLCM
ncbi:UbiA prenyltransferase [Mycena sanguinolenta]|uniref:UbiA prenyltransferase n=1 Tax=Mycena sanguinolenta TaxID=230812 RepID=A0A8H7DCI5_9AGAR|nr:UbiA prenyltransferase [Mycena sanguinolenta]